MAGCHLATLMKRTFSDLYSGGAQFESRSVLKFASGPQGIYPSIPFPSLSFPIHRLLLIQTFGATSPEPLTATK
jgi:hypothetical protein